jgi:hypothetical protein
MALAMVAVFSSVLPGHAAGQRTLDALLSDLRLTEAGSRDWLGKLGVDAQNTGHERLLAVAPDGRILRVLDGSETTVIVTPEFDGDLMREDAAIVLVHNHPASTSLSQQDLAQLEKPGVATIVAIGHDGSVYAARRKDPAPARHCAADCYAALRDAVSTALRIERPRMKVTEIPAESFATHLAVLAIARAGYLDYAQVMAPARRAAFAANVAAFGRVVATARATLRR